MDVVVGDRVPEVLVQDVSPEKMKTMAALIHDPNPIHWDAGAVAALGMGDRVVNQGPSNMAYIINALIEWTGDAGSIRNVRCRFKGNVFAHDRLTATGVVTAVRDEAEGRVLECDVWLDRDGTKVVTGTARVVLSP